MAFSDHPRATMSKNLDKSLDELIRDNRTTASRGGFRRQRHRGAASTTTLSKAPETDSPHEDQAAPSTAISNSDYGDFNEYVRTPETASQHVFLTDQEAPSTDTIETGTKLYISNLNELIDDEDIRFCFSKVGELKECLLNYDKHGRPRGTAEVVYNRRCDAVKAVGSYNNYPLRGWPVKIDIVDANVKALVDLLGPVAGSTGNTDWASNSGRGRGGVARQGGWSHGFGRERGRSKKRNRCEEISAETLISTDTQAKPCPD